MKHTIEEYQEALDELPDGYEEFMNGDGEATKLIKCRELLQELIDKQTPKKPTNQKHIGSINDCYTGKIITPVITGKCSCGITVYFGDNYCKECGDKLDWSEDNLKEEKPNILPSFIGYDADGNEQYEPRD